MEFSDYLRPEGVRVGFRASDKPNAVRALAEILAVGAPSLDADVVFDALYERERLATTGVGSGVAIPHARVALPDFRVAVAVSPQGVPFDAVDGEPARILVALLAPEGRPSAQLTMLARVSRLLRDDALRTRLLAAQEASDVLAILQGTAGPA